jgi:NapC/NirT cytochrome c family, N-terminal region/Planctomycete cytochrome C
MYKRFKAGFRRFFFPPDGSPRRLYVLPYLVLAVLFILLVAGGISGWEYTNSPKFCGYTCHSMPPQNAGYLVSPHANVYCTECHVGRSPFGTEISRKIQAVREIYATVFHAYTYPIFANRQRPARETCEKCHQPEAFSGNKLLTINHFLTDENNTPLNTYLIMKTGGGAKVQGLGHGIHWHIINKVEYYTTDDLSQTIPFVRVYNDDGTTTDYVDTESNIDPAKIDPSQLKTVDCITCHNRVTHDFAFPSDSVDSAMSRGLISPKIPEIRNKAVEALTVSYASQEVAMSGIAGLENYYTQYYKDFYANNAALIKSAITELQAIYNQTVFIDQEVDWTTHPDNLGHINSAGCFRCHDGKHMNSQNQAIRLECNVCHSIPVVSTSQDFVTDIEISSGPEPSSHLNPNWISLHHNALDDTCGNCHTITDAGGTSNTSFCSNSACHGTEFKYAGFNAPSLRSILEAQLPPPKPTATPAPVVGNPTFDANIQPLFIACTECHNSTSPSANLDLSTYAGVMKGGKDGMVVIPGDSANSLLIKVQTDRHFRNLSTEELALVKQWIDAGALEK